MLSLSANASIRFKRKNQDAIPSNQRHPDNFQIEKINHLNNKKLVSVDNKKKIETSLHMTWHGMAYCICSRLYIIFFTNVSTVWGRMSILHSNCTYKNTNIKASLGQKQG